MDTLDTPRHAHTARFYESDSVLCDAVAAYISEGLEAGESVVLIVTAAHQKLLRETLFTGGIDLDSLVRDGRVVALDTQGALALFMRDDLPVAALFEQTIGRLMRETLAVHDRTGVRAFGEMVDVLWRDGNVAAAIRLEELWNELAAAHPFSLLCAYALSGFIRESQRGYFEQVCSLHSHVIPVGPPHADAAGEARELARLQQRVAVLESELALRRSLEADLREALSARLRTEQELLIAKQEAERANHVKSQFMAVMSHELRTPLNAIIGYDDLLAQEVGGPTTDAQKLYIGRIRTGAEQLVYLIDQILSLARIEAGREELLQSPVDIAACVTESAALIEPVVRAKGLDLHITMPADAPVIITDGGKLRQILLNLLSNAAKFTMEGSISLDVRPSSGMLEIEVRDTGVGIDASQLHRIFEPFVQVDLSPSRRYGGTGLGLSVSRQLAGLMAGEIVVASTRGAGSSFTLRVPAAYPDATVAPLAGL